MMPAQLQSNLFQSANGFASVLEHVHSQAPVSENQYDSSSCGSPISTTASSDHHYHHHHHQSASGLEATNGGDELYFEAPRKHHVGAVSYVDGHQQQQQHYHPGKLFDATTLKQHQDTSPWATNSAYWNGYYYQSQSQSSTNNDQSGHSVGPISPGSPTTSTSSRSTSSTHQELVDPRVFQQQQQQQHHRPQMMMMMPTTASTSSSSQYFHHQQPLNMPVLVHPNHFAMPRSSGTGTGGHSHEAPSASTSTRGSTPGSSGSPPEKPKYYVAHEPVPPEKLSKYSELTAHLEFMLRLEEEERQEKQQKQKEMERKKAKSLKKIAHASKLKVSTSIIGGDSEQAGPSISPIRTKKRRQQRVSPGGGSGSVGGVGESGCPRKTRVDGTSMAMSNPSPSLNQASGSGVDSVVVGGVGPGGVVGKGPGGPGPSTTSRSGSQSTYSSDNATSPPPAVGTVGSTKTSKQTGGREPKKLSISQACTFCRERKVPCGRPPADVEDQTCNQCARRKFICRYPKPGEKSSRRRHS